MCIPGMCISRISRMASFVFQDLTFCVPGMASFVFQGFHLLLQGRSFSLQGWQLFPSRDGGFMTPIRACLAFQGWYGLSSRGGSICLPRVAGKVFQGGILRVQRVFIWVFRGW